MELSFDTERDLLQVKRKELLDGVAVIDEALAALGRGSQANGTRAAAGAESVRAGRRPMSAKAKKAASLRMKKYWRDKRKSATSK